MPSTARSTTQPAMTAAFFPALPDGCFFGAAARSAAVLRAGRLASNLPFFLIRIPPIQKPQGDIIYFVVLYINRPFFATAFPTGTGSGILKFLLTFSGVRATLLCRGIPACLRQPILFRLAGKEWGEKGRLDVFGACCRYDLGKYQFYSRYEHTLTLQALNYAPPVTVHQD